MCRTLQLPVPPSVYDCRSYYYLWRTAKDIFDQYPDDDPVVDDWAAALHDAEEKFGLTEDREKLKQWRRGKP